MKKTLMGIIALAFTVITGTVSSAELKENTNTVKHQNYVLAKMAGHPVNVIGYTSGKPFHVFNTSKLDAKLYGLEDQKTINQKRLAIYLMAGLI